MAAIEIPLIADPQTFNIRLAGNDYRMQLAWNVPSQCWCLDIFDASDVALVNGIPLVTGTDLLEQYGHLGIGGALYVETDGDASAVPTFDNLGSTSRLYFVTP